MSTKPPQISHVAYSVWTRSADADENEAHADLVKVLKAWKALKPLQSSGLLSAPLASEVTTSVVAVVAQQGQTAGGVEYTSFRLQLAQPFLKPPETYAYVAISRVVPRHGPVVNVQRFLPLLISRSPSLSFRRLAPTQPSTPGPPPPYLRWDKPPSASNIAEPFLKLLEASAYAAVYPRSSLSSRPPSYYRLPASLQRPPSCSRRLPIQGGINLLPLPISRSPSSSFRRQALTQLSTPGVVFRHDPSLYCPLQASSVFRLQLTGALLQSPETSAYVAASGVVLRYSPLMLSSSDIFAAATVE
ncbi:hypothetical protein WAI453_001562 [Rhynchosporium graminicola]